MNGNSALDYVVPVPQIDVMGAMMKAEQIRQLHLQNQQIEQQLMATQQTAGPATGTPRTTGTPSARAGTDDWR